MIFFLLIFLLSFPAHSAPRKKRLILSIPATEKLAFHQEDMRASIKSYIDKKRVPNGMILCFWYGYRKISSIFLWKNGLSGRTVLYL